MKLTYHLAIYGAMLSTAVFASNAARARLKVRVFVWHAALRQGRIPQKRTLNKGCASPRSISANDPHRAFPKSPAVDTMVSRAPCARAALCRYSEARDAALLLDR